MTAPSFVPDTVTATENPWLQHVAVLASSTKTGFAAELLRSAVLALASVDLGTRVKPACKAAVASEGEQMAHTVAQQLATLERIGAWTEQESLDQVTLLATLLTLATALVRFPIGRGGDLTMTATLWRI